MIVFKSLLENKKKTVPGKMNKAKLHESIKNQIGNKEGKI